MRTGGSGKGGISALIISLTAKGVSRRKILNSGVAASGLPPISIEVSCSDKVQALLTSSLMMWKCLSQICWEEKMKDSRS